MSPWKCPSCDGDIPEGIVAGSEPVLCPACGEKVRLAPAGSSPPAEEGEEATFTRVREDKEEPGSSSARRSTFPVDPLLGSTVGGCEILSILGRGAMGTVYEARQTSIDRLVAVKTIRQDRLTDTEFLERFRKEARTSGRFRSPHVVPVYDAGSHEGLHYLVMEHVGGGTLRSYAEERGGRLDVEDALRFLEQAAEGLLEAEKLGVVHRDIKPGNLLLDDRGRLKVADFGIAKMLGASLEETLTNPASCLGTPIYMSPEQSRSEKSIDHRSDMYSLGATFFELLTGVRPVEGDSAYEVIQKKNLIGRLSPRDAPLGTPVPEPLSRIIEKMTALRVEDRYESFQEVLDDLERVRRGLEPKGIVPELPEPPPPRKRWALRGAAAVAVVLLLGLAYLLVKPHLPWSSQENGPEVVTGPGSAGQDDQPGTEPDPVTPGANPVDPHPIEPDLVEPDLVEPDLVEPDPTDPNPGGGEADPGEEEPDPGETDPQSIEDAVASVRLELDRLREVLEVEVRPPFQELESYWKQVRRILEPPPGAGRGLRARLEAERESYETKLKGRIVGAIEELRGETETVRESLREWKAPPSEVASRLAVLEKSRERLAELFPGQLSAWKEAISDSYLDELRGELQAREDVEKRLRSVREEVSRLSDSVNNVKTSSGWSASFDAEVEKGRADIAAELDAIIAEAPQAPIGEQRALLKAVEERQAAWRSHTKLLAGVLENLQGRRLSEASASLERLRKTGLEPAGVEALSRGCEQLVAGFQGLLEELDLSGAEERFREAARELEGVAPEGSGYATACADRARELAARAEGGAMAPVAAGRVRVQGSSSVPVDAFFLDRYETTVGEYRAYLREERGRKFEDVSHLWPDEALFRAYHGREPPYFRDTDLDEEWPVEEANYYQARAYLLALGKDLPTIEEWYLAARGPLVGGRHRFDEPTLREHVHWRSANPARVGVGGRARAFVGSAAPSVHHLSGNVAEWCRVPEGRKRAPVVGGRYLDSDWRYFTGEALQIGELGRAERGYGFRGVLRPRDFFRDLLPADG